MNWMKCPDSLGCLRSFPTSTITSKHSPFFTRLGAVMIGKCFFSRSPIYWGSDGTLMPQKMSSLHSGIDGFVFVSMD
jgi:hypothetical protein